MARASGSKRQSGSSKNPKSPGRANPRNSSTKTKRTALKSKKTIADSNADRRDASDALSEDQGSSYEASETEDAEQLDSDALDEEDGVTGSGKKRKQPLQSPKKKSNAPLKKRRKQEENDEEEDEELPEGVTVVGKVVHAPTEGRVPAGQISQNTIDFLKQLANPECNDREWFKLHEPVFRQAEKEWKDWIEVFTPILTEVDDQIPELPTKDVIHRIYRDVRFSNDKTPYKQDFSASFSRSGRKGIFAHYYVAVSPGRSLVAGGAWQPGKNELASIRNHILHNSSRLRNIISDPEFVKFFGNPLPHLKGERQSIFGHEDELKVAPKGIDKNHKDIDLLKLRSVAVVHYFLDSEVTATDFKEKARQVIRVLRPLVHCLNDMMTLPVNEDDDENAEEAV